MRILSILICGCDEPVLQQMARALADEGVKVETSNLLNGGFRIAEYDWDVMLIDLDGLNSFMRSLLPAFCSKFPHLPLVGISRRSVGHVNALKTSLGFELDAYLFELPRPEELIVSFPQVAQKYLCDTGTLNGRPGARPLPH